MEDTFKMGKERKLMTVNRMAIGFVMIKSAQ